MNNEKLWKMFSPIMAEWIRNKSEELRKQGLIPTTELLLEELENGNPSTNLE